MAFTGGQIAGLVIGITAAFFICLIYFCKGAYVVNQSQVMIVERFGKYSRTLTPGFHWVWPYVEAPRYIDWRYISMNHSDTAPTIKIITTPYIDLREHVLDLQRRDVITKDTVQISVDALVYFRITDPRAAVYRIQNLPDAIEMLTQSTLRNIIAGLTLDETFSSREYVNDRLINEIEKDVTRWGVLITRLAIEEIRPPSDIRLAMESQIQEERERRSTVIRADGNRESEIIRSRGTAAQLVLTAEGTKLGDISRARGDANAKIKLAEAEAERFTIMQNALKGEYRAADYMATVEYFKSLDKAAEGGDVFLLPKACIDSIGGSLRSSMSSTSSSSTSMLRAS